MSKDPHKLVLLALLSQNNVVKTLTTTQDRMHDSSRCNISQPLWTQDNPTKTDSNATATWIDMIVKTVLPSQDTACYEIHHTLRSFGVTCLAQLGAKSNIVFSPTPCFQQQKPQETAWHKSQQAW